MPGASVSVLVATLGEAAALESCLQAIREQAAPLGGELVLAVNAGASGLPAHRVAAWRSQADLVLFEPRPGKSHALNAGLAACGGDLVAFADDDALPMPGWLDALVRPFENGGADLAGTGGRVWPVFPEGGPPAWYRPLLAGAATHFLGPWHDLGHEEQDYEPQPDRLPLGANLCLRRAVLADGGFRTDLGPSPLTGLRGGEDTEMVLRLLRRGLRLRYCPRAVVQHPVTPERLGLAFVEEAYRQQGRESVFLARALGRPLPPPREVRRRRRREACRGLLRALRRDPRRHRHRMRRRAYQGRLEALAELQE